MVHAINENHWLEFGVEKPINTEHLKIFLTPLQDNHPKDEPQQSQRQTGQRANSLCNEVENGRLPQGESRFFPGTGPVCPRDRSCLSKTLSRPNCLLIVLSFPIESLPLGLCYMGQMAGTSRLVQYVPQVLMEVTDTILTQIQWNRLAVTPKVTAVLPSEDFSLLVTFLLVTFPWLFRGFFVALICLEQQCLGVFRGFPVALILGKFYAYSPWKSLLIPRPADVLGPDKWGIAQVGFRGSNATGGRTVLLPGPSGTCWAHCAFKMTNLGASLRLFQDFRGHASARRVSHFRVSLIGKV